MADGEITISELELSEELLADMVIPVETSTDTKSATLAQLRSWLGTSLPIGSIFASVGKIDDARFTLLDGKTLSATGTYAEFYLKAVEKVQAGKWQSCTEEEFNQEVSQYGQCMKFVISNDYVRIPKAGNSLYSANFSSSDVPVVGNGKTLGLSTGTITRGLSVSSRNDYSYGLTVTTTESADVGTNGDNGINTLAGGAGNWKNIGVSTNAGNSGIIAKTSTLNLNNITTIYYYMVISTEGQTEPVDIDINQVYEDMELKANKDFSNVDNEGKSLASGWGMPSSRYISVTIGASGASYTAPANGWFIAKGTTSSPGAYVFLDGVCDAIATPGGTGYNTMGVYIPVRKNELITYKYGLLTSNELFFSYAEGEN